MSFVLHFLCVLGVEFSWLAFGQGMEGLGRSIWGGLKCSIGWVIFPK
jgi:hypothetical protein